MAAGVHQLELWSQACGRAGTGLGNVAVLQEFGAWEVDPASHCSWPYDLELEELGEQVV